MEEEKHGQRRLKWWIALFLFSVIFVAGSVYVSNMEIGSPPPEENIFSETSITKLESEGVEEKEEKIDIPIGNLEIYRDEKYKFEFNYPVTFRKEQFQQALPGFHDEKTNKPYLLMEGMRIYHTVPTGKTKDETCYEAYSGVPRPCPEEDIDTEIGIFVLEKNSSDLSSRYQPENILAGNKEGVRIKSSVEGDGTFFYLFPLHNSSTLVMTRRISWVYDRLNIDNPHRLGNYDEVLFDKILTTLKFNNAD